MKKVSQFTGLVFNIAGYTGVDMTLAMYKSFCKYWTAASKDSKGLSSRHSFNPFLLHFPLPRIYKIFLKPILHLILAKKVSFTVYTFSKPKSLFSPLISVMFRHGVQWCNNWSSLSCHWSHTIMVMFSSCWDRSQTKTTGVEWSCIVI